MAPGPRGGNASTQTTSPQTAPAVPDGPAPASEPAAGRVEQLEAELARVREQLAATERQLEAAGSKESKPDRRGRDTEPAYVGALVDALADGKPLAFGDVDVPPAVERRLRAAGRLTNRPVEPSFGMSEGQRQDLAATGKTVSPFTGTPQVGTGKPGEKPRAVSPAEHAKAQPPTTKR